MCGKSKKPAAKQKATGPTAPPRGAEAARTAGEGAPAAAVGADDSSSSKNAQRRRRGMGKRNFRLAGQNKLNLNPARANVGGSGRSGLNIPASS